MDNLIFSQALGINDPWFIDGVDFDISPEVKTLTIRIDFSPGARFSHDDSEGLHPVHDTQVKRYRHLNFFQHECILEARIPRVRLPDGRVATVTPPWAGKRSGFTLLFEAFVLMLAREMNFTAVGRIMGLSRHRVHSICERYVDLALEQADLSNVRQVAIDETSRAKGHDYITVVADTLTRSVIYATCGRDADALERFAQHLLAHNAHPEQITGASIDMSPAFIKGVAEHLPNARVTFDKFHIIAQASAALDQTRRAEQKSDPSLKGLRWTLLRKRDSLNTQQCRDLDAVVADVTRKRTARAWQYLDQLRAILNRKQINVVHEMLWQWCTNVNRSKVEPMKRVAAMIRKHLEGIVTWTQTRQTNGFMEALNGLFQIAKRQARGLKDIRTIRTVLFLIAGKLDFTQINPHTRNTRYA